MARATCGFCGTQRQTRDRATGAAYLADLRREGRWDSVGGAESRFNTVIGADPVNQPACVWLPRSCRTYLGHYRDIEV